MTSSHLDRRTSSSSLVLLFTSAVIAFTISACNGQVSTSSKDPESGSNAAGAAGAAGAGADAGADPAPFGAGQGAATCSDSAVTVSHACLQPKMRAGTPLEIYVEDATGCYAGSCDGVTAEVSCNVSVEATTKTVTIDIGMTSCVTGDPNGPRTCTSDCRSLGVMCKIPPLPSGTYKIVSQARPYSQPIDRTVVMIDDATAADACLDSFGPALAKGK